MHCWCWWLHWWWWWCVTNVWLSTGQRQTRKVEQGVAAGVILLEDCTTKDKTHGIWRNINNLLKLLSNCNKMCEYQTAILYIFNRPITHWQIGICAPSFLQFELISKKHNPFSLSPKVLADQSQSLRLRTSGASREWRACSANLTLGPDREKWSPGHGEGYFHFSEGGA